MSDDQVQAMMQNWRDALAKQMDEMRVRQWCVEKAIEAALPGKMFKGQIGTVQIDFSVPELAKEIFKFITTPFAFKE